MDGEGNILVVQLAKSSLQQKATFMAAIVQELLHMTVVMVNSRVYYISATWPEAVHD